MRVANPLFVLLVGLLAFAPRSSLPLGAADDAGEEVGLRAPDGFEVTLFAGDDLAHDIFSLTLDSHGRVVVAGRNYIKTLLDDDGDGRADRAVLFSTFPSSGAHGLCFVGDDLYVTGDHGVWRLRDRDGDLRADGEPERIAVLKHPEHGANGIVHGPDGRLYVIGGNDMGLTPEHCGPGSPVRMPNCGGVLRLSLDGKESQVLCHGLRNPYDFDFDPFGRMFTVDADGERDQFLPWYVPNRLFDLQIGGHHGWVLEGWRRSWSRPGYFPDAVPPAREVGRGSPTGVVTYRHRNFPERYHGGLFSCCWTFGRVYHFPLKTEGASYRAEQEVFLETTGTIGFAPVDLQVTPAGDMLVAIGGRNTRGSVFRVRYVGGGGELPPEMHADDPLRRVLAADQPLAAWSRARWTPAAKELGAEAFLQGMVTESLPLAERIRAVEILTELFGGIDSHKGLGSREFSKLPPELQARVLWSEASRQDWILNRNVEAPASSSPPVLRTAWERLETLRSTHEGTAWTDVPEGPAWRSGWSSVEARVRHSALRSAARLPAERRNSVLGTFNGFERELARLWVAHYAGELHPREIETLLAAFHDTVSAERQLEAVRLMQLCLGDVRIEPSTPEVYAGYAANRAQAVSESLRTVAGETLLRAFPGGTRELEWELARTIGMLEAPVESAVAAILARITQESDFHRDLHHLIVLSRLAGHRNQQATAATANGLARLHGKLHATGSLPDRNWPLRVGEIVTELCRHDPALPEALAESSWLAQPDQAFLVFAVPEKGREAVTRGLLSRLRPEDRWTSDTVAAAALLPAGEHRRPLRDRFEEPSLRDAILRVLAREPHSEDRERFARGLASVQPDVVADSARALAELVGRPDEEELAAAFSALRHALRDPKQAVPRAALRNLLGAWIDSLPGEIVESADLAADHRPFFDWVEMERPALHERLSRATDDDAAAWAERLKKLDWTSGDSARGALVFEQRLCAKCHAVGGGGDSRLGPSLAGVGGRFSAIDLMTAILEPNRDVSPAYQSVAVETASGRVHQGILIYDSPDSTMLQTGPEEAIRIAGDEITATYKVRESLMPAGLLRDATDQEAADLVAFLRGLRQ